MKRFIGNIFVIIGINFLVIFIWQLLRGFILGDINLDKVDLLIATILSTSLYAHWLIWRIKNET